MTMAKDLKKPLDAGFKRNLIIIGGAVVLSAVAIGAMAMFAGKDNYKSTASETQLDRALPRADGERVDEISPAMKERLAKVQQEEAIAAYREGRSYVPESTLGRPESVNGAEKPQRVRESRPSPGPSPYTQYTARHEQVTNDGALAAQRQLIERGLSLQLEQLANGFSPAQAVTVSIKVAQPNPSQNASNPAPSQQLEGGAGSKVLFPGLQIAPGRLDSPINTDKSRFASVTITAGPLQGAYLIGQALPMTLSGDVEDVGVQLTQMRFNNKVYPIDAILLNEQTATDMMDADVDRHLISKHVLPVVMAGLSGLSTFFTAQGNPGVRYSPTAGVNGENIIVDQPKASREEAKQQGIGKSIEALVSNANEQTARLQQRPNTATLEAFTPVGVLFRQPVLAQ